MKSVRGAAGAFLAVLFLGALILAMPASVSAKAPGRAGVWQTGASAGTASLSWQKCEGAAYYKIYYRYASQSGYHHLKDIKASGNVQKTSVKLPKAGRIYRIRVAPCRQDGKSAGDAYETECRTLPGKIGLRSQKSYATSRKMRFYWKAEESAAGYELLAADLAGQTVGRQRVEGRASAVVPDLFPQQFYRLRIRGYCRIDGKIVYGAASYTYVGQQPRLRFKWASHSAVMVSWAEVEGAADYAVYISDDPSKGFKRVKTVKERRAVVPGLNRNWRYYVYVVANMRRGKTVYATPRTHQYSFRLQIE